jgi:hypothetical protein
VIFDRNLVTSCQTAPAVASDRIIGPFGRILALFSRILLQCRWFLDNDAAFRRLLERREKSLMGLLFCRHRGEAIASMCVVGHVGPFVIFDSFWILTNKTSDIWRNFFTSDLRISSSFLRIFSDFFYFFFQKFQIWIPKFTDFRIRTGPIPSHFGEF